LLFSMIERSLIRRQAGAHECGLLFPVGEFYFPKRVPDCFFTVRVQRNGLQTVNLFLLHSQAVP